MIALIDRARARLAGGGDAGFTLIELLVASTLFLGLSAMIFTTAVSSARAVRSSREYNDLNEEARVLLNRLSRELREAREIMAVTNPGGTTYSANADSSIRFYVDFNGNNVPDPVGSDPEHLMYTYDRANSRVTLQAAGFSYPVLAANVSFFRLSYNSRVYSEDGNGGFAKDGTVTWQELDADPQGSYGNANGVLDAELNYVDSVTIDLTVLNGSRRQEYRTQVDLRNRPY